MRIAHRLTDISFHNDHVIVSTDGVDLKIQFLTDLIVRIRSCFDDDCPEASYSLITTAWADEYDDVLGDERKRIQAAHYTHRRIGNAIEISSKTLTCTITRDPFTLEIRDRDGRVLHRDLADRGYIEDSNHRRIHACEISPDDYFYGFGEKTGEWNKAGTTMTMSPADAMGYDPVRTDSLYKHIPFYIKLNAQSRCAVGYFYHTTWECDFDMGRSKSNYWPMHSRFRADGGEIDLFVIAGPRIDQVVKRFCTLVGTCAMLPKRAFGYLGSSMFYPELASNCDREILGFVDTCHSYNIPISGFQLSSGYTQHETSEGLKRCVFTWNRDRFPDPGEFFDQMDQRGVTVSPNVKPGILLAHPDVEQMKSEGLFIRNENDDDPAVGTWWGGPGYFVDFTSTRARDAWKARLKRHLLSYGTSSIWNDNCEYDSLIDKDARCDADGRHKSIGELKSVLPNLMCRTTLEAIEDVFPDQRPFIVCRSGHTGIQRYAQTWAGDNCTSWESLRYNIATILGMGLCGVANHGCDIGGFYGPAPEPELLVRWIQNGIFQPRFSIHSVNTDNTVTQPWMYHEYTSLIADAIRVRYRLMPYLYSLAARAHEEGTPIMQPVCMRYQDDPSTYNNGTDFTFGDGLLVANVLTPGAQTRHIDFPGSDCFYDFATRTRYEGGSSVDYPVTLSSIPVFITSGAIVCMNNEQTLDMDIDSPVHHLKVICAADKPGQFVYYEDDGKTNAYRRGVYRKTLISMTPGRTTTIDISSYGDYPSDIRDIEFDVIHPEKAPHWVSVDDDTLRLYLNRKDFEKCDSGWYYSASLGSVLIRYHYPNRDHRITVCFEQFDMIGM